VHHNGRQSKASCTEDREPVCRSCSPPSKGVGSSPALANLCTLLLQLLNKRSIKLCTVDSVITLRRKYTSCAAQLSQHLVDNSLGEHWLQNCAHNHAPTYTALMARGVNAVDLAQPDGPDLAAVDNSEPPAAQAAWALMGMREGARLPSDRVGPLPKDAALGTLFGAPREAWRGSTSAEEMAWALLGTEAGARHRTDVGELSADRPLEAVAWALLGTEIGAQRQPPPGAARGGVATGVVEQGAVEQLRAEPLVQNPHSTAMRVDEAADSVAWALMRSPAGARHQVPSVEGSAVESRVDDKEAAMQARCGTLRPCQHVSVLHMSVAVFSMLPRCIPCKRFRTAQAKGTGCPSADTSQLGILVIGTLQSCMDADHRELRGKGRFVWQERGSGCFHCTECRNAPFA
jgi:hypothetical protein